MNGAIGGFWSYARRDEQTLPNGEDALDLVRAELEAQVGRDLGCAFPIWRDAARIAVGQRWQDEILSGVKGAGALIALLSPSWLRSTNCRKEYAAFLEAGGKAVFPVLLRVDPLLDLTQPPSRSGGPLATLSRELRETQWTDWTELRPAIERRGADAPAVKDAICALAKDISNQLRRLNMPEEIAARSREPASERTAQPPREAPAPKARPRRKRLNQTSGERVANSPASLHILSREDNAISPDAIDLIIETHFEELAIDVGEQTLSVVMNRARLFVDWWGCDIEDEVCESAAAPPNAVQKSAKAKLSYRTRGEWRIAGSHEAPILGDPTPSGPLCTLINCQDECGAQVRLVARPGDFTIKPTEYRETFFSKLFGRNQTKAKLASLFIADAALPSYVDKRNNYILAADELKTQLETPSP